MERYGLLFAVGAAILWGIAPVFEKAGLIKMSPLAGLTLRTVSIALVLSIVAILTGAVGEVIRADVKTQLFIITSGIIAGLIGMWAYFEALKRWEASRVVPIAGSYPLVAFILAVLFLGEQVTIPKLLGAILVVVGVILLK